MEDGVCLLEQRRLPAMVIGIEEMAHVYVSFICAYFRNRRTLLPGSK